MKLIIADRLPVVAGRYAIQETTLELAQAIVQDCSNQGLEIVGVASDESNAKRISEALGCNVFASNVDLTHGDELIVYEDGTWWHCWYYND